MKVSVLCLLVAFAQVDAASRLCQGDDMHCEVADNDKQMCLYYVAQGKNCTWTGAAPTAPPATTTPDPYASISTTTENANALQFHHGPATSAAPLPTVDSATTTAPYHGHDPGIDQADIDAAPLFDNSTLPGMPTSVVNATSLGDLVPFHNNFTVAPRYTEAYMRLQDLLPSTSSVGWGSFQVDRRWYEAGF